MPNTKADLEQKARLVRRVLVCEPDAELRQRLCDTLRQAGWNVEEHEQASSLLSDVTRPGADTAAVVVALDAPGVSGLDFVDYLHSARPSVPIVLLAMRGPPPTLEESRRAGVSITLERALDFDALSAFLAHVVGRRRLLEARPTFFEPRAVTVRCVSDLPARAELPDDRRREERYELDRPREARLRVASEERSRHATIVNVTSRGCGLVHRGAPVPINEKVTVECRLPHPVERTFRIAGRIAWSRPAGDGNEVGIEFARPDSSEARKVVYDLLVAD